MTISHAYVPASPPNSLEMAAWEAIEACLSGRTSLESLFTWVHQVWQTIPGTLEENLAITRVLGTILGYERQCMPGEGSRILYTHEQVYERIQDLWDYMAHGVRTQVAGEEKVPLVEVERLPSLLERDIRAKIRDYLDGEIPLGELIPWLNNPLLLWETIEVARNDPVFYEWVMRIHRACVFYTDSSHTRESEVYDLFSRLLK